jgi:hypothetical protein
MDLPPCNFTTRDDLIPYLSLSQPMLNKLVEECNIVCVLIYGPGNPDLAGVGISSQCLRVITAKTHPYLILFVVSYAIDISLAILFGPLLSFENFILRTFISGYTLSSVSKWIQKQQQTLLWTQLFTPFQSP